jgi:hypothetical protein
MENQLAHLESLMIRLYNERSRFENSSGKEKDMRAVWVAQCEREIENEKQFLADRGITFPESLDEIFSDMDDNELLSELLK